MNLLNKHRIFFSLILRLIECLRLWDLILSCKWRQHTPNTHLEEGFYQKPFLEFLQVHCFYYQIVFCSIMLLQLISSILLFRTGYLKQLFGKGYFPQNRKINLPERAMLTYTRRSKLFQDLKKEFCVSIFTNRDISIDTKKMNTYFFTYIFS